MSSNVETDGVRKPGAYYVARRAAGSVPQWGRQAPARGAGGGSGGGVDGRGGGAGGTPPSGLDEVSLIDAECEVVQTAEENSESDEPPQRAPEVDENRPINRLSRQERLSSIGFTVVGEGGSSRILPFDAQMLSSRRLMSSRSMMSQSVQEPWNCVLCSYENADGASITCSVCGSERNPQVQSSTPSSRESIGSAPSTRHRVNQEEPREESNRRSSTASQSTAHPRTSFSMASITEETGIPEISSNRVERPSLRKSLSFTKMMGMSFAPWSNSDSGPWTCETCTYLNQEKLHLRCEVCGQPRLKEQPDEAGGQSMTDCFNASHGSGQALYLDENEKALQDLEQSVIERERMTELIEEQARILSEMKEENDSGSQQLPHSLAGGAADPSAKQTCRAQVEVARRHLQEVRDELERVLDREQQELELFEQVQLHRRAEIESEEGVSLHRSTVSDSLMGGNPSHSVLEWMAQQRMLDDWKLQRAAREEQLQDVQHQQAELFDMYEKMCEEERNGSKHK